MPKQLNVNLSFTADTRQARKQLQDLQSSLQDIAKLPGKASSLFDDTEIKNASKAAMELQQHLNAAVNVKTGNLDLSRLSTSLKSANKDLNSYYDQLIKIGPQGQNTFLKLAKSISTAEAPVTRVNAKMMEFGATLKNTVRWQISSSILHGFMGTLQGAYGYAQDLNESLNDIRIVTGQSVEDMARFAEEANKSAKALSSTTTAYTDAALIFYQQGLDDSAVKERTDAVIKMSNVTGEAAADVSSYMTAIWNNFADESHSLEHYADVITALGAATASSSEEIAGGLEKFAAIGKQIGLSYEYATTALATVVSRTRQSEDVVGTAFKTIFARIQGLKLGETLEDGTDLNKYSQALNAVGINIKDTTGNLKDMDTILDEMGARWVTLSKDQQVALAQTVAGTRQYNQLVALMDSWQTSFQDNLAIARDSEGSLQEQADIYAESWEAASKRVKAAAQGIYQDLLDDEFFIGLANISEKILEVIKGVVDGFGGMKGVMSTVGSLFLGLYARQMPDALNSLKQNLMTWTGLATMEMDKMLVKTQGILSDIEKNPNISSSFKIEAEGISTVIEMQEKYNKAKKSMTDAQRQDYEARIANVRAMYDELKVLDVEVAKLQEEAKLKQDSMIKKNVLNELTATRTKMDTIRTVQEDLSNKGPMSSEDSAIYNSLEKDMQRLEEKEASLLAKIRILKEEFKAVGLDPALLNNSTELESKTHSITDRLKEQIIAWRQITETSDELPQIAAKWELNAKQIKEGSNEMQSFKKNIDLYINSLKGIAGGKSTEIDKTLLKMDELKKKFNQGEISAEAFSKEFSKLANTMKTDMDVAASKVNEDLERLRNQLKVIFKDNPDGLLELEKLFDELGIKIKLLNDSKINTKGMEEDPNNIFKASTAWTQFASSAMATYTAINSLKNAFSTFNEAIEGNASAWDVVGVSVSALMSAMMAFTSMQSFATTLIKKDTLQKQLNMAMTYARAVSEGAETTALGANTAATWAQVVANIALQTSMPPLLVLTFALIAAMALLVGAIAGVVAIVKFFQSQSPEAKLKALEEQTKQSAEAFNRVSESVQEVKNKLDELSNSYNTIDKLTKGTDEWYEAVSKVNYEVSELLKKYPELSKSIYNDNGVLKISQEGLDSLKQSSNERVQTANNIVLNNQRVENEAKIENNKNKMASESILFDSYDLSEIVFQYSNDPRVGEMLYSREAAESIVDGYYGTEEDFQRKYGDKEYGSEAYQMNVDAIEEFITSNKTLIEHNKQLVDSNQQIADSQLSAKMSLLGSNRDLEQIEDLLGENGYQTTLDTAREKVESNFGDWNNHINYSEDSQEWGDIKKFMELQGDDVEYVAQRWGKMILKIGEEEKDFTKEQVYSALAEAYSNEELSTMVHEKLQTNLGNVLSNVDVGSLDTDTLINLDNLHLQLQDALSNIDSEKVDVVFEKIVSSAGTSTSAIEEMANKFSSINWGDFENIRKFNAAAQELESGKISIDAFTHSIDKMVASTELDNMSGFFEKAAEGLGLKEEDAAKMQEYAKNLMEIAEESDNLDDKLATSADGAADLAVEIYRMNKGIDSLADGFEDWSDVIKNSTKESQEYSEAMYEMKNALADVLDVEADLISSSFVEEHLEEIEKAAKGDAEAIDSLRSQMDEEIIQHITIGQPEEVVENINRLQDELQEELNRINTEIPDIEIGAILQDAEFLEAANNLVQQAGMTADEANAYFAGIGYEPVYSTEEIENANSMQIPDGGTELSIDNIGWSDVPVDLPDWFPGDHTFTLPKITYSAKPVAEDPVDAPANMRLTAFSGDSRNLPQIKGMRKKATGSSNNYSSSNKGGKSPGKSSGGGGSTPKHKTKDKVEKFDADPFHKINQELEDVEHNLSMVNKQQSHMFGGELINNLKQQNKLLNQQMQLHQQKVEIAKSEAAALRSQLAAEGVAFSGDNIANYNSMLQAAEAQINSLIAQYNALSAEEQEAYDKAYEGSTDPIKQAEKYYEELKKNMDKYSKYMSTVYAEEEAAQEALYRQIENNLEAYKVEIELKLDMTDAKRSLNEFLKNTQMDIKNLYKTAGEWGDVFKTAELNVDTYRTDISTKLEQLNTYKNASYGGENDIFATESEKYKAIIDLEKEILQDSDNLFSAYQDAYNSLRDAFGEVAEQFGDILEGFDDIDDTLDHYAKVIELTQGADTKEGMESLDQAYSLQKENSLARQEALRDYKKSLEARKAEALAKGYDEDDSYIKDIEEEIRTTSKNLESEIENYIDVIQRQLENSIKMAKYTMDQNIWGAQMTDVRQEWDDKKAQAEGYYDTVERIYQLESLESKWKSAITSTSSLKAQQQLTALMEKQVESLTSKTALSEKDIELAEKELQVYQAQIALEEAQNNKNSMKLTRDEAGNWSYQYVADEGDIASKQEDYLAKMNEWRTASINAAEEIQEKIMDAYEAFSERMTEIMGDVTLSEQEREEKIAALNETYWGPDGIITKAVEDSNYIQGVANRATYEELASLYLADEENLSLMSENEKEIIEGLKESGVTSYTGLRDFVIGEDKKSGMYKDIEDRCKETNSNSSAAWKSMAAEAIGYMYTNNDSVSKEIGRAYDDMEKALDDYNTAIVKSETASGIEWSKVNTQLSGVQGKIEETAGKVNLITDKVEALGAFEDAVLNIKSAWDEVALSIRSATSDLEKYISLLSGGGSGGGGGDTPDPPPSNPDTPSTPGSGSGTGKTGSGDGNLSVGEIVTYTGGLYYHDSYGGGPTGSRGPGKKVKVTQIKEDGRPYPIHVMSSDSAYGWLTKSQLSGFDTGGYTGDWSGGEGRLAMLHSKEIVLNKEDTKNILEAVTAVRSISSLGASVASSISNGISNMVASLMGLKSANYTGATNNSSENSNNTFEITMNVDGGDVEEIQRAILDLPNLASQFLSRR